MKTLTLALMLFTSHCFAQVTLTSANNPAPGDADRYVECDTAGITEGNSGANQNWNFQNIVRQDSTVVNFVASGSTPYAASFPNSNVASSNDDTTFSYLTTSQNGILVNGYGGPDLLIPCSNPQSFLEYPFSFNSSFNDQFSATYTAFGSETFRKGTTTVLGDAWGTISLPNGTFTNALRVKYVISTKDSSFSGVPVVVSTIITSYNWFVPGRKFPIFEVIYTSIILNGVSFGGSKVVSYSPNSTTIGIHSISSETPVGFVLNQNYPNPFNPATKIRFAIPSSGNVKLTVFNELGQTVAQLVDGFLNNGSYEVDWNAGSFSSGVYYYKLESGEFVETKKMILNK